MKKKVSNMMERFSFAQMTSNGNGKTSASGTMGALIIAAGTFGFLLGILDKVFVNKDIDIITQAIVFTSIGAGLLGLRKYRATSKDSAFAVEEEVELLPEHKTEECTCPEGCKCGKCERCS
jgi:hypothetical protein